MMPSTTTFLVALPPLPRADSIGRVIAQHIRHVADLSKTADPVAQAIVEDHLSDCLSAVIRLKRLAMGIEEVPP